MKMPAKFVVDLSIDEFIAAYDEGYIQSTGGNQISDAVYAFRRKGVNVQDNKKLPRKFGQYSTFCVSSRQ